MIKAVYCFRRRAGMSREDFAKYFREVHGPIGAAIPGLRKLVQSVSWADPAQPQPAFDGMAELWFDDFDALVRARGSAEWAASTADERHFIDPESTAFFIAEERALVGDTD